MLRLTINSFLIIWVLIEILTLRFIFYMSSCSNNFNNFRLKYYITQSLVSVLLIINFILWSNDLILRKNLFMILLIIWKLGMPPFHGWFINLIIDTDWWGFMLISSVIKVVPLFLTSIFFSNLSVLFRILGIFVSGISGASQVCLKKIIGYSSIFTSGWVILCIIINNFGWVYVFMVYFSILVFFCRNLRYSSSSEVDSRIFNNSLHLNQIVFLTILRLRGVPPFSGFFIKAYVICGIVIQKELILSLVILIVSSIRIYIYIKTTFKYISLTSVRFSFKNFFTKENFSVFFVNIFSGILLFII